MNWEIFLNNVVELPLINTENLLVGCSKSGPITVQISRWKKSGKIIQLKRGLYLLAKPYRKVDVYEPHIASVLKKPSYISLEKALEYHNMIPEAVSVYTSVTPKRQAKFVSEIGVFDYRHIQNSLFWGYESVTINKQTAFIALAEKALLDFFYFKNVKISLNYLEEMRLQDVDKINIKKLFEYAVRFKKPKMLFVCDVISRYISSIKNTEKLL